MHLLFVNYTHGYLIIVGQLYFVNLLAVNYLAYMYI